MTHQALSKCGKMAAAEEGGDRVRAVSFAAGTAAFMACVERAFVVSVFVHWRVWAFLALNLLLLAILFTSKSQNVENSNQIQCKNGGGDDGKLKRSKKTRRKQPEKCVVAAAEEEAKLPPPPAVEAEGEVEKEGKVDEYDELTEEELKQRVENFIAMFRQHLVCDAKGTAQIVGCANAIASRVY